MTRAERIALDKRPLWQRCVIVSHLANGLPAPRFAEWRTDDRIKSKAAVAAVIAEVRRHDRRRG